MIVAMMLALVAGPITEAEVTAAVRAAPVVRRGLDAELRDYPSARFRDVHVAVNTTVEGNRGSYFCGFVNAKNAMGAYVGWREFMASGTSEPLVVFRTDEGDTTSDELVNMTCGTAASRDPMDRSALLQAR